MAIALAWTDPLTKEADFIGDLVPIHVSYTSLLHGEL